MEALHQMITNPHRGKWMLTMLACVSFACSPHERDRPHSLDLRGSCDNATRFMRPLYGEWVVTSVVLRASAEGSKYKDRYEGTTIRIAPDLLEWHLSAVEEPRYRLEVVRHSHVESEVPSRPYRRTSAFELYETDREVVYVINVYDQNGDYHGGFEFIRQNDEIAIVASQCMLIAERKGTVPEG